MRLMFNLRTEPGPWTMDPGPWTLDPCLWPLDSGLWTLDCKFGEILSKYAGFTNAKYSNFDIFNSEKASLYFGSTIPRSFTRGEGARAKQPLE